MKFAKEFNGFSKVREDLQQHLEAAAAGQGREFAGEILAGALLQLFNETRSKYMRLARRIEAETDKDIAKYAIRMTVIDKSAYNPIHPTWFPILENELQSALIGEKDLCSAIGENKTIDIKHVFIAASDENCRKILSGAQSLPGFAQTDQGEIPALFRLTKSAAYRREVADLYKLFYANQIPWTTLNTAYLDKFFTARLERVEGRVPQGANLLGARIDYGAYSGLIDEGKLPLWNVRRFHYSGEAFPFPCVDSVNYEHELPLDNFAGRHGFLIETSEEIADIRHEMNEQSGRPRIVVATPKESALSWNAREIIADPPKKSLGYDAPILSNEIKTKRNAAPACLQLKTKAQLERVICDLDIEKFIRFTGYELLEVQSPYPDLDDMNWFIQSERFDPQSKRILRLHFSAARPGHYLNDAMARFAASSVQLLAPEYRCIGVLDEANT